MNIDVIIVISFLIINLFIGIYCGRGITTLKYYAIGNRNFSTATITATIIATWIGAGFFYSSVSETYHNGLWHIVARLGDSLTLLIVGFIIAPRIGEFFGKLTVAEIMDSLYGKKIRIITAISSIAVSIGYVAVQIKVFSTLFHYFLGIPYIHATLIGSFVIIIYSSFGGILSVTFTDIIQIFTFGVFTPIFALFLWMIFGSSKEAITATLSVNPLFDYKQVFDYHNMNFYASLILFIYFTLPALDPATFQRILMARSTIQVRKSFTYAAILCLLISVAACCIGIITLVHNPKMDPNDLLIYVIEHWSFPGLKGWILIAIMAMGMSTADSYINAAAVIFSNDICRPLGLKLIKSDLLLSRICAAFIGITAIMLIFCSDNLFELLLLAGNFYTPIVTVPLMMAIFGFRSTPKAVLIGMVSGLIVVIGWRLYVQNQIINVDSIIPGTLANLIGLLGTHYLFNQPGGWTGIKDPEPLTVLKLDRKRKLKQLISEIKEFNIINFCKSNLPIESKYFSVFGAFIIISTYSAMYMIPAELRASYKNLYNFIYHSVFIISFGFLTYPVWQLKFDNRNFVAIIWNIGVFYMFVCVAMMLTIISGFGQMQLMILILNLMAIGILFRWRTALFMTIAGIIITTCFFKWYTNSPILTNDCNDIRFKIIYFLLLFSGVLIAFIKPKQQLEERSEALETYLEKQNQSSQLELVRLSKYKEEFINRLDRQCIEVFKSIHNQITILEKGLKHQNKKNQKIELIKIVDQLKAGAEYLDEVIWSTTNRIYINPIKIKFEPFINDIIKEYQKLNKQNNIQLIIKIKNQDKEIEIDQTAVKKMFTIYLDHCITNSDLKEIIIIVEDSTIEYETYNPTLRLRRAAIKLSISCNQTRLRQEDIAQILNPPDISIDQIKFAEAYKIITAHYGKISITLKANKLTYSIVIPTKLKEIRPKKQDIPDRELENFKVINDLVVYKTKELMRNIAKQLIKIGIDFNAIAKITNLKLQEIKELELEI